MDYDGFRQMVLGANLMPSKAGQLDRMFDPRLGNNQINHTAKL